MKFLSTASLLLSLGLGVYSQSNITDCLAAAHIETIAPTSPSYRTAIRPLNSRTPWYPAAVAIPGSEEQVSAAVKCASQHSLKVQPLGGGHSYGAFGLGGQNGSLVINMKHFRGVSFDSGTNIAVIGSGMRLGDIALALYANGKRDIPHGVCGGVGIGGHATHGGFGFTSRMWGTTLDVVVGMDVVLADGSRKYVDKDTDPDLFWAFRGAGDSFGIITKFHVQTLLAPEVGTVFNFTFPGLKTAAERVAIFKSVQDFSITADAKFHMRAFSVPSLGWGDSFTISGVYWGPKETYLELIEPLASAMPNNTRHLNQELDYLTALSSFDQWQPLAQREPYNPPSVSFFTKSIISPDPLSDASLTSFFNFITSPNANTQGKTPVYWYVIHDLYGGQKSRIGEFPLESASYAGRDALWTMQLYSSPAGFGGGYPAAGFQFMQDMVDSVQKPQPETNFSAYPNYVDPSLKKEDALRLYYGPQLERLKQIKRKVDKNDMFWNPQSVSVGRPPARK
ncbi:FAD-binding domain-containing protein [Ascobolus immersus RN42]|uniref:FAD-binding domain-containing protein n=1 Tax=Ascobolus immersus RN42 TaxID=1160509 RepID=A0A3N4I8X6_ASCIM|nr:FAD-binding domain-containing protein [Ascobolus immersus RN42]